MHLLTQRSSVPSRRAQAFGAVHDGTPGLGPEVFNDEKVTLNHLCQRVGENKPREP